MRSNTLVCITVFAFILAASVVKLTAASGEERHEQRQGVEDETANEDLEKPVDWKQIWFQDDRPERIKITLYDMKTVDGQSRLKEMQGLGIAGDKGLVFETRDPIIVGTVQFGLSLPLRVAIPDEPGYGAGGLPRPNLGRIEVFTKERRRILVGINCDGFTLGSEVPRTQNIFYSWMIAKQLDDIVFLKTERHIPNEILKALSGEAHIENDKRGYETLRSDARKRP